MKKLLIVSALMLGLTQCKKEDAKAPDPEFNAANVAGTYKITGLVITAGGIDQDVYATQYPACNKDDNHIFTAAGNYTLMDIGLQCTPPTATVTGTYSVIATPSKKITFNGKTYDVVTFTALSMVVSENIRVTVGTNTFDAVQKLTLTRQ